MDSRCFCITGRGKVCAVGVATKLDGQMAGLFQTFPGERRKHATVNQEEPGPITSVPE